MNNKTNIEIIGAGGNAKVIISTLCAIGLDMVGVYDDDPVKRGQ